MKSVEITFRNKKDQTLVLALVDRLKAEVIKKQKVESNAISYLNEIAKEGGLSMKNPVEWQQKNRKERVIR
jgi:hypothetical protein